MSDQDRISQYNINKKPSRKVMWIKKNINKGIIRGYRGWWVNPIPNSPN